MALDNLTEEELEELLRKKREEDTDIVDEDEVLATDEVPEEEIEEPELVEDEQPTHEDETVMEEPSIEEPVQDIEKAKELLDGALIRFEEYANIYGFTAESQTNRWNAAFSKVKEARNLL